MPTRQAIEILGCEGAEGTIQLVVGTDVFLGLRACFGLPRARWAFALGGALAGGDRALADAVKTFVASLEPTEPVFYRADVPGADLDRAVVREGDEASGDPRLTSWRWRPSSKAGMGDRMRRPSARGCVAS